MDEKQQIENKPVRREEMGRQEMGRQRRDGRDNCSHVFCMDVEDGEAERGRALKVAVAKGNWQKVKGRRNEATNNLHV